MFKLALVNACARTPRTVSVLMSMVNIKCVQCCVSDVLTFIFENLFLFEHFPIGSPDPATGKSKRRGSSEKRSK